jgi:DNA-binding beta-propeller fold protein YncE
MAKEKWKDPKGIIAIDKVGGKVLFLNPTSLETQVTLDGFVPRPHELAISPDQRFGYVSIYGDGIHGNNPHPGKSLAVIDLQGRKHIGDIDLSPYVAPHGSEFGPDGLLYVVCEDSGVVVSIDTSTRRIVNAVEIGSKLCHRISLQKRNMRCWTENEEDSTSSVLDLGTHKKIKDIKTPNPLVGLDISPDEKTIVLVDANEPQILVVDTEKQAITGKVRLEGHDKPAQIAHYSPDGRWLTVTSYEAPLGTIFSADLKTQKLLHLGKGPMNMAYHPNGETVVIANHDEGSVAEVELATGIVLRTVPAGKGVETLSYF